MQDIKLQIDQIIDAALVEDLGAGDHTSLAIFPPDLMGRARCIIKDTGVLAGVAFSEQLFAKAGSGIQYHKLLDDGSVVQPGDIAFTVEAPVYILLTRERLCLNVMQRMSGIASLTAQAVKMTEGTACKVLDTRKTTPLIRVLEKWAVAIGGGVNHRFGLYDMILIKDNHIDFAGGVAQALEAVKHYLNANRLDLKVVCEVRTLEEVEIALKTGGADRLLLDNMPPEMMRNAVALCGGKMPLEASGGITLENLRIVAETGVDFASLGCLTHSAPSMDMSLKAY